MATTHKEFNQDTEAETVVQAFSSQIKDKIIVITGVNAAGIGGATATALASQAPRLLVLCGRNKGKVDEVISDIKQQHPNVEVVFQNLDLSSQASARQSALDLLHNHAVPHIDLLINNAGIMNPDYKLTPEGIELHFATNHVGHFIFTNHLVPKLVEASKHQPVGATRIINVSSRGVRYGPVRFSDMAFTVATKDLVEEERPDLEEIARLAKTGIVPFPTMEDKFHPQAAYAQSKVANVLYSLGLNQLLFEKHGILSLAVHPGAIQTELTRHHYPGGFPEEQKRLIREGGWQFKTLSQGASTQLVTALDPALTGCGSDESKTYFADCQIPDWTPAYAIDASLARKLWSVSEELVGEKFEF